MARPSPQHVTLQPNITSTVTFDRDYGAIEILNLDGTDEIWVAFGPGGNIVPMTTGTYVLPAVVGFLTTDPETSGPTVVRMMSPTQLRVSVRGVIR